MVSPHTPDEPGTTSADDHNESVRAWSLGLPGAMDVAYPGSDTVFDQAESSRTETTSTGTTHVEIPGPTGPRYSEFEVDPYRSLLSDHAIFEFTTGCTQRTG